MKKNLILVTSNLNKAQECKDILSTYSIPIDHLKLKIFEVQSDTIEEIAKLSSIEATKICKKPILVEDSGLFINALNGFPGPYSSYIQNKIGNKGVLKLMEGIGNRNAVFKSVVGFCKPKSSPLIFVGEVKGSISLKERGKEWAFDPIFVPDHFDKTYAEMLPENKNTISHRRKALERFALWFKNNIKKNRHFN